MAPTANDAEALVHLVQEVADAITDALAGLTARSDWALSGGVPGQHGSDLVADAAALERLDRAGVGVLSEESGVTRGDSDVMVVIDPLDGSTNAAHALPWYATSICAVVEGQAEVALVRNLASGVTYRARRGAGATRDGEPIRPSSVGTMTDAMVGLSGYPSHPLGWRQFRALGAVALDLCAVADGTLDAYIDCSTNAHGSWDYLGGMLILHEAGGFVTDAFDRPLVALGHADRRTPVAGATGPLQREAVAARRGLESRPAT